MKFPTWMMPWYMSVMYSVPSGAVVRSTGRKYGSSDLMNSFPGYALWRIVSPSLFSGWIRRTMRATGSPEMTSPTRSLWQSMSAEHIVAGAGR